MPAPKTTSKDKQAAGPAATKDTKKKDEKPVPAEAAATTAPKASVAAASDSKPKTDGQGKPDQAAYNKEQDDVKKEIDELNVKLVSVTAM